MADKSKPKPLLFIDTVQTELKTKEEQTVFDSRVKKKKIDNHEEIDDTSKGKGASEPEEALDKQDTSLKIDQEKEMPNKIMHQINLLDKRAKQDHFVYIEVIMNEESYFGFFKGVTETCIILSEESHERELKISEIESIKILKV